MFCMGHGAGQMIYVEYVLHDTADTGACGGEQIKTRAAAPAPNHRKEEREKQSISTSDVKVGL